MQVTPTKFLTYKDKNGREPFEEWLDSLSDQKTQSIILNRLNRVSLGNFGDCRNLGQGIYEIRIHYGSGFRVYFGTIERVIIVLLLAGAKKSQKQNITKAKEYWQDFKKRNLK